MRRAGILTGGVVALISLAVLCIPRHLPMSPQATASIPATFHASFEEGNLVLRGSLPNERSKSAILEQAHVLYPKTRMRVTDQFIVDQQVKTAAWVDKVPELLPILGLMADRGSIVIDGRSLKINGEVTSPREKADVLQVMTPAIRAGLRIEDHVRVTSVTASPPAPAPAPTPVSTPQPSLQLSLNQVLSRSSIEFKPNSAAITRKGQAVLDQIVVLLQQSPNLPIEIAGHTDSIGKAEYNMELSRRRADAVREYFTVHGLTNPFTTIGYGSTRPLAQGRDRTSRQQNRRIELLTKGPSNL
jgi:OmpA-OmpF porin, OOP family